MKENVQSFTSQETMNKKLSLKNLRGKMEDQDEQILETNPFWKLDEESATIGPTPAADLTPDLQAEVK